MEQSKIIDTLETYQDAAGKKRCIQMQNQDLLGQLINNNM